MLSNLSWDRLLYTVWFLQLDTLLVTFISIYLYASSFLPLLCSRWLEICLCNMLPEDDGYCQLWASFFDIFVGPYILRSWDQVFHSYSDGSYKMMGIYEKDLMKSMGSGCGFCWGASTGISEPRSISGFHYMPANS